MSGGININYSYDANGNLTSDGTHTYTYDNTNRLASVTTSSGTDTYQYNALGERVEKTVGSTTTVYVYDEAGHLIGEYTSTGGLIAEHIWLGNRPIGVITSSGLYYVQTDQLGTPRVITNSSKTIVWQWHSDPFGNSTPTGSLTYNLRFPGQYYDAETGHNYNYFRYYDPTIGRYIESDPIGLGGGVNTYAYTLNSPLGYLDPFGLFTQIIVWQPVGWGESSFGHVSVDINGTSFTFGPKGMTILPTTSYLQMNSFRSGVGSVLTLTPRQEAQFEACLKSPQGTYSTTSNNCANPVIKCLRKLGFLVGPVLFPVSLGNELLDSGLVHNFIFYPQTTPANGVSAPWAR